MKKNLALAGAVIVALALSACAGGGAAKSAGGGSGSGSDQLVIDTAFDVTTLDPGRLNEPAGNLILHGVYETALKFTGPDAGSIAPNLADYKMNADNTVMTLTMHKGPKFPDGTPVTAEDAAFSYNRMIGIKGNPATNLDGITVEKISDTELTLTSKTPAPQLPVTLANQSLGIVEEKVVKEHGGTMDPNDKAESYLNTHSAGSGPYTIEKADIASQVSLVANPKYWGPKPAYKRVVIRNVQAATQLINIKAGTTNIVTSLSADQTAGMPSKVKVYTEPSNQMLFVLLNQNPEVSKITSNPKFVEAVRKGIDFDALLKLAGKGAVRTSGIVAPSIPGTLPIDEAPKTDVAGAKAALAASGYKGETVKFSVGNDITIRGVSLLTMAQSIQAQMKDIGINFVLDPAPTATALTPYRDGKQAAALWYIQPSQPHNFQYLEYIPGGKLGLRAGWAEGADPQLEAMEKAITVEPSEEKRNSMFLDYQRRLNEVGPYIPLLLPPTNIVASTSVSNMVILPNGDFNYATLGKK